MSALLTPRSVLISVLIAVVILLPVYTHATGNQFPLILFTRIVILAIAATSLNLILGYGGMVSFGHAAYLGVGAYAVGILAKEGIASGFVQWPVALAVSALFALVIGALAMWRGRMENAGRLRHWLGRLEALSPRKAFLAGFLAVSLNAKNAALTLSVVHGIRSATAGVGESVAVVALFIVVATLGVCAPAALSIALPGRAGPLLEIWRLRLLRHSRALVAWVLLGSGTLLGVNAVLTLLG